MLLDGGVGALPKVLEAYMGEVALLTDPTRSILDIYASGCYNVGMLLHQRDDQLKIELSWMEVHI